MFFLVDGILLYIFHIFADFGMVVCPPNLFEACRMPFWKIELPWHGTRVAWWHLVGGKLQEGDINDSSM